MASLTTSTRSRRGTQPEFPLNQDINKITKKKPSSGETKNNNAPPPVDVFDLDKIYQFKWAIPAEHFGNDCDPTFSLFRNQEAISYFDDIHMDGYGRLPSFENYGYVPIVSSEMAMHFVSKMLLLKEEGEDAEATAIKIKGVVKEYHEWVATQEACHKESLDYELVDIVTSANSTHFNCDIVAIILKVDGDEICFLLNSVKEEENCVKLMNIVNSCDMWDVEYCGGLDQYSIEDLKGDEEGTAYTFDFHYYDEDDEDDDKTPKLCREGYATVENYLKAHSLEQLDESTARRLKLVSCALLVSCGRTAPRYDFNECVACGNMLCSKCLNYGWLKLNCLDCWNEDVENAKRRAEEGKKNGEEECEFCGEFSSDLMDGYCMDCIGDDVGKGHLE